VTRERDLPAFLNFDFLINTGRKTSRARLPRELLQAKVQEIIERLTDRGRKICRKFAFFGEFCQKMMVHFDHVFETSLHHLPWTKRLFSFG